MSDPSPDRTWLTMPELVEALGVSPSRIRRLIEDRHLLGQRRDGVLSVPADFLSEDGRHDGGHGNGHGSGHSEPLPELRGTLIVLADAGFSDDEAIEWLLSTDEALGAAPIDALRSGRKTEVRRVAQALG